MRMLRWYIMQTYTGREEKLVKMIHRVVPRQFYGDCFVIYHEQLWRRQQENQVHIRRVFPGYVFITSENPDGLFLCLKQVPAMSKLLADGKLAEGEFTFLPLDQREAAVLGSLLDEDHIIRLSYVATDGKDHVSYVSGPLGVYVSGVSGTGLSNHLQDMKAHHECSVNYRFRKRYAAIKVSLSGEEKEIQLGIILNDDIRRELSYGKVEAPVETSARYQVPEVAKGNDSGLQAAIKGNGSGAQAVLSEESTDLAGSGGYQQYILNKQEKFLLDFVTGDAVIVSEGALAGLPAVVCEVEMEKREVKIKVHLFGRDLEMRVPGDSLRKVPV